MKNTSATFFLLLIFPTLASSQSNEYQFESGIFYNYEDSSFLDTHTWAAQLRYYWDPITYSSDYPNAEVAFVNRLPFVDIAYIGSTTEDTFLDIATGIRVAARHADKDSRYVFNIGYLWSMADLGFLDEESHTHALKLGYGYYLLDNFLIQADFEARFQDTDFFSDVDTYIYGINGKYLWDLGNENWLSVGAAYAYHDIEGEFGLNQSVHEVKANIDYYFTLKTSFQVNGGVAFTETERAGFSFGSSSRSSDQEFASIGLHHYFLNQLNVIVSARNNFFDSSDEQIYSFAAFYRF